MTYNEILNLARNLRKNQTLSEIEMWNELRNRKLDGKKFLRQYPFIYESNNKKHYFFIADFYCAEHKLVIELDGEIHQFQKEKDYNRDLILNSLGLKVLRIKNDEIKEMEKLKNKIKEFLTHPLIPSLSIEKGDKS